MLKTVYLPKTAFCRGYNDKCTLFVRLLTHKTNSDDSDQTRWMPRLISVFSGYTAHCLLFRAPTHILTLTVSQKNCQFGNKTIKQYYNYSFLLMDVFFRNYSPSSKIVYACLFKYHHLILFVRNFKCNSKFV